MFSPSYFTAVLLFALFVSIVFAITMRSTTKAMVRFGAWCFALFSGAAIALSWVMFLLAR